MTQFATFSDFSFHTNVQGFEALPQVLEDKHPGISKSLPGELFPPQLHGPPNPTTLQGPTA